MDQRLARHGYQWWYVDAISDDQSFAFTAIFFIGSVFSPRYYAARQRYSEVSPEQFCAVNVVIHALTPQARQALGTGELWCFTEHNADRESAPLNPHLHRGADYIQIGQSSLKMTDSGLEMTLHEPTKPFFQRMPRRLIGRATLSAEHIFSYALPLDQAAQHEWIGVAPHARIKVELSMPCVSFEGSAYHDVNRGNEPLEEAFDAWTWCRAELPQGSVVLYDLLERSRTAPPSAHSAEDLLVSGRSHNALLFRCDGVVEPIEFLNRAPLVRGLWGVKRETRVDPEGHAEHAHTLVDAPFYTRDLIETQLLGVKTIAVYESLDLRRFKRSWVRYLLGFKVKLA